MATNISQLSTPADDAGNEDEEDDYMSMIITEPSKPKHEKETYTQRRTRKEREVHPSTPKINLNYLQTTVRRRPKPADVQNPRKSAKLTKPPRATPHCRPRSRPQTKASR